MDACGEADGPGQEAEVAQTLGGSFFDPKIKAGFLFKVDPALTLLLRVVAYLLLPEATGIACCQWQHFCLQRRQIPK